MPRQNLMKIKRYYTLGICVVGLYILVLVSNGNNKDDDNDGGGWG